MVSAGKLKVTPVWGRLGKTAPLEGSQERMLLKLAAPEQDPARPKAFTDLVVVLDVSGSMAGEKLQKLKETMVEVIRGWLRVGDHLCIITFATDASVAFPMQVMRDASKNAAVSVVNGLQANGWTQMEKGLQLAVNVIKDKSDPRNRAAAIILMSDGAENQGSDARQVPVQHLRVDTIGFGTDHEYKVLDDISRKSDGGVYNACCRPGLLAQVMSPLLDTSKHIVISNLVLTLEQQAPTMTVDFGTYPQETDKPAAATRIRVGSLAAKDIRRVWINFFLPPAQREGKQTVMKVKWNYSPMPAGAAVKPEEGSIDIDVYREKGGRGGGDALTTTIRTRAFVVDDDDEEEVPKKVRTEEIRLSHVKTIKDVRALADAGRFDEAQDKLALDMGALDGALEQLPDSHVSKGALRLFYAEVEELLNMTESEEIYKRQGGQACVHACISSHDRQRYAARGDNGCCVRLFTTPRMSQYLDEAIEFDAMTSGTA